MEPTEATLARVVGARLRRARRQRGWSQAALARAVARSRTTVSRWEAGHRLPPLEALAVAARALDWPLAGLVVGAETAVGGRAE